MIYHSFWTQIEQYKSRFLFRKLSLLQIHTSAFTKKIHKNSFLPNHSVFWYQVTPVKCHYNFETTSFLPSVWSIQLWYLNKVYQYPGIFHLNMELWKVTQKFLLPTKNSCFQTKMCPFPLSTKKHIDKDRKLLAGACGILDTHRRQISLKFNQEAKIIYGIVMCLWNCGIVQCGCGQCHEELRLQNSIPLKLPALSAQYN